MKKESEPGKNFALEPELIQQHSLRNANYSAISATAALAKTPLHCKRRKVKSQLFTTTWKNNSSLTGNLGQKKSILICMYKKSLICK